jgi:predicted nucleotidyltransferase
MNEMLRRRLRRAAFSIGRLPGAGRSLSGYYRVTAQNAASVLSRDPDVLTVYLCRGSAKGEQIHGISDVDMAVIVRDDGSSAPRIQARYARLRRLYPLLDPLVQVWRERDLAERNRWCVFWRFRLEEGRRTFVRLAGPPCIESLPTLPEATAPEALRNESNNWWDLFAEPFLGEQDTPMDPLVAAATCVKSIAESLRMRAIHETGTIPSGRRDALLWAVNHAGDEDAAMARLALTLLESRFSAIPDDLPDRTLTFLLHHMEWMHRILAAQGRETDPRHLTQAIDDDAAERPHPLTFAGATPFQSVYWPVGETLYGLSATPTISGLRERIREARAVLGPNAPLFLRHGDLFLQIGAKRVPFRGRAVMHPLVNPESFAAEVPLTEARWPERLEAELIHWRAQAYWRYERGLVEGFAPPGNDWSQRYVKAVQLEAIRRSALRGEAFYPMTAPAVLRAARREGISISDVLLPLFSPDEQERTATVETLRVDPELLRL